MNGQPNSYDALVMKNILANNEFGIKSFTDFKSLATGNFDSSYYSEIDNFIKTRNFIAIETMLDKIPRTEQYIEVIDFSDQDLKRYVATVYDSDALEQKPEVIKIYRLSDYG
jgi:hypothetical protein